MSAVSIVVAAICFALALVWVIVGVSGLRGTLRRNRWLGVRTPATLASEEAFRLANRVAAPGTLGSALVLVGGGLLTLGIDGTWSVLFGVVALLAGLAIVGLVSGYAVRAANTVAAPAPEHSCACCAGEAATPEPVSAPEPADDCGESSCASCALSPACSRDTAQH
ncbi:MAG: SdpI family protein [Gordonia sp. (in: high G+C Gram-positive bacteria)]